MNYALTLSWVQVWSKNLETFSFLGLRNEEFDSATSSSGIKNTKQTLTGFGAGYRYRPTNRISYTSKIILSQKIYHRGISNQVGIQLDRVAVLSAESGVSYKILKAKKLFLEVEGGASVVLPRKTANYHTQFGMGYYGQLMVGQEFKRTTLSSGLFYRTQSENTSILKSTRTDAGLVVGLRWSLP